MPCYPCDAVCVRLHRQSDRAVSRVPQPQLARPGPGGQHRTVRRERTPPQRPGVAHLASLIHHRGSSGLSGGTLLGGVFVGVRLPPLHCCCSLQGPLQGVVCDLHTGLLELGGPLGVEHGGGHELLGGGIGGLQGIHGRQHLLVIQLRTQLPQPISPLHLALSEECDGLTQLAQQSLYFSHIGGNHCGAQPAPLLHLCDQPLLPRLSFFAGSS
mmetsp:Transcript_2868/g.8382  ORF Transcript_2868/g.8382 Transcript_2868/m.8382 type:complete len:213 (+) Transcript_2868:959-1597(+)